MESRKLKRMLELKRRMEQAAKGELANAKKALDVAHGQLAKAQGEQRARVAALADQAELNVTELSERARFVVLANESAARARELVAARHAEVSEREQRTVEATREVRTFELLYERDGEQKRAAARSAEQRAADELAGARRSPHEST